MTDILTNCSGVGLLAQHRDSRRFEHLNAGPVTSLLRLSDPTAPSLHHGHLVQLTSCATCSLLAITACARGL